MSSLVRRMALRIAEASGKRKRPRGKGAPRRTHKTWWVWDRDAKPLPAMKELRVPLRLNPPSGFERFAEAWRGGARKALVLPFPPRAELSDRERALRMPPRAIYRGTDRRVAKASAGRH